MSRWEVRRSKWFKNNMVGNPLEYLPGWSVTCGGQLTRLGGFSTWREAMDYADRQARTVEVTVPGDPCVRLPDGIRLRHSNIGWYVDCYGYFIVVPDNELKSLALALLSAHYRQYL
ncbi:hypothetical protein CULCFH20161_05120 [Corynebacterium ulcerans]|uniref:hypothetical protein n=1 Tax=Corynebacterium ulcerans TaxID=65058 RepID=UPI00124F850D|nr:hypothetical protein [Corynebacterium ulcerans]BBJ73685.1 hypothetical protein CULCFH20161_05120 [Corynebacterium ulcerans]